VGVAQRVLAKVLTRVGAHQEARGLVDDALSAIADVEWRVELAATYWIAGRVYLALGQYEQARQRFESALILGRESNTVEAVVYGQLGLGRLAAEEEDWSRMQHLCTEARAIARRASLELAVIAARLGLARAHIARSDWRWAQHEASQALDASVRLGYPHGTLHAEAMLGEVSLGLGQASRADRYYAEASATAGRLADTLPPPLSGVFLGQAYVRAICDRANTASASSRA
jgi:tetratricopeptide (TPR) repeat protein